MGAWRSHRTLPGDALNHGYRYLEVKCDGCGTDNTVDLSIIRRPHHTPIWQLKQRMRCKPCSEQRDNPYMRGHLVQLRRTRVTHQRMERAHGIRAINATIADAMLSLRGLRLGLRKPSPLSLCWRSGWRLWRCRRGLSGLRQDRFGRAGDAGGLRHQGEPRRMTAGWEQPFDDPIQQAGPGIRSPLCLRNPAVLGSPRTRRTDHDANCAHCQGRAECPDGPDGFIANGLISGRNRRMAACIGIAASSVTIA